LTEYGVPVSGRAACRAELTRPDNTNGTIAMAEVEPGVFEAATPTVLPGIYRFRIMAEGRTLRGRRFTREQTLTGAVWKGGDDRPPSSKDEPGAHDYFCRLIDCLLHQKGIQEWLRKAGLSADELRRYLEECCPKPTTGHRPPLPALEARLRAVLRDERLVKAALREFERE
jgi:hypothetical protein